MVLRNAWALVGLAVLLGSCSSGNSSGNGGLSGSSSTSSTTQLTTQGASTSPPVEVPPHASTTATKQAPAGTTIKTATSQFGDVLFDGRGQAIYLFAREKSRTAECYGDCAVAWPPVLTDGLPHAVGAASQKLLGTTTRNDGSVQVTYAGHPLYFYAHEGPSQVTCHNVSEFGGLWLVLGPDGEAKT